MKKVLVVVLALVLVFSVISCGKNEKTGDVTSIEELATLANATIVKPVGIEITNEAFKVLDGKTPIYEYAFHAKDVDCILRFAKVGVDTDISGVKLEDGNTLFEGEDSEHINKVNDLVSSERWITSDGQYVFVMFDNGTTEWAEFEEICAQFRDVKPINWENAVSYEDHLKICGFYSDDVNFGYIDIHYDHARMLTYIKNEAGNLKLFEAELSYDGVDKLSYDKVSISENEYDESLGYTVETKLPDGPSGYVTIADGKLHFDNSGIDELKDLVLEFRTK